MLSIECLIHDCSIIEWLPGMSNFMSTLRVQLGRAVRRLRSGRGFSQESFADHVGVHRTYMGAVERGEQNVSLGSIERIASGLGMTPSQLFLEAEHESP
jgi:transcriptional regulator with XRE-family HTH domain